VTELVELVEIDDDVAAALRGDRGAPLEVAPGFPRKEDVEGIRAHERGALAFLITIDGVVVGTCGAHGPPNAEDVVELGWGLVATARGRGVGTAAVTQLLERATHRYPTASIVAHTEWSDDGDGLVADSAASEAILARLNFVPDRAPGEPGYRGWRLER
jgi:RimJ/RimL family protein N-acetyltransferase